MTSTPSSSLILLSLPLLFLLPLLTSSQSSTVTYKVQEETDPGTYVGNVLRDSELYSHFNTSQFSKLVYKIPDTVNQFRINDKSSTLRTNTKLDRETECEGEAQCVLTFGVSVYSVTASNIYVLLKIVSVRVEVEDVNDNAPYFLLTETTLDVAESAPVGQVLPLSPAIDADSGPDNNVQRYLLVDGGDVFDLDENDLGIVLRRKLDREEQSTYKVKVIAEDGGFPKLSGSIDVTINVIDVNDNRPTFSSPLFNATVAEDEPVGAVVLTLLASDSDAGENGRMSFAFSSVTPRKVKNHFAINETSGELSLVKALDYEKDKRFEFTAVVSDGGSIRMTSQAKVVIEVKDVNDNAPQIDITWPSSSFLESIQVGTYIGHISLSDLDSSQNTAFTCR